MRHAKDESKPDFARAYKGSGKSLKVNGIFRPGKVMGGLVYNEVGLAGDQWGNNSVWMPVGRVGWHSENSTKLIGEITSVPTKSKLLSAGFAKGDSQFFDMFIENFKRIADRLQWM